jgi:hypothetical protein
VLAGLTIKEGARRCHRLAAQCSPCRRRRLFAFAAQCANSSEWRRFIRPIVIERLRRRAGQARDPAGASARRFRHALAVFPNLIALRGNMIELGDIEVFADTPVLDTNP